MQLLSHIITDLFFSFSLKYEEWNCWNNMHLEISAFDRLAANYYICSWIIYILTRKMNFPQRQQFVRIFSKFSGWHTSGNVSSFGFLQPISLTKIWYKTRTWISLIRIHWYYKIDWNAVYWRLVRWMTGISELKSERFSCRAILQKLLRT